MRVLSYGVLLYELMYAEECVTSTGPLNNPAADGSDDDDKGGGGSGTGSIEHTRNRL